MNSSHISSSTLINYIIGLTLTLTIMLTLILGIFMKVEPLQVFFTPYSGLTSAQDLDSAQDLEHERILAQDHSSSSQDDVEILYQWREGRFQVMRIRRVSASGVERFNAQE